LIASAGEKQIKGSAWRSCSTAVTLKLNRLFLPNEHHVCVVHSGATALRKTQPTGDTQMTILFKTIDAAKGKSLTHRAILQLTTPNGAPRFMLVEESWNYRRAMEEVQKHDGQLTFVALHVLMPYGPKRVRWEQSFSGAAAAAAVSGDQAPHGTVTF